MNDRIIGYIVIFALVLLLGAPAGYIIWQAVTPQTVRKISFDDVKGLSFLAIQDPVRLQGVEIGVVTAIEFNTQSAIVTIKTETGIKLYEDYQIFVMAKGVMGDRYLTIMPGDSLQPQVPANRILHGTVTIGPDEALSYINDLREAIHKLNVLSQQLKSGTASKQSLVADIWHVSTTIDTVISSFISTFRNIDTALQNNIGAASEAVTQVTSFAATLADSLPEALATLQNMIDSIDSMFIKADIILTQTGAVVSQINNPELLIWKKYQLNITNDLKSIRKMIHAVESDSFTIPVRLW